MDLFILYTLLYHICHILFVKKHEFGGLGGTPCDSLVRPLWFWKGSKWGYTQSIISHIHLNTH